jgi:hypothetical protein
LSSGLCSPKPLETKENISLKTKEQGLCNEPSKPLETKESISLKTKEQGLCNEPSKPLETKEGELGDIP